MIGWFILTLAVGVAGGLIAKSLKVPAGTILGAMIAVAILNIATDSAYFPSDLRVPLQILSGAMIGSRISKRDILGMKTVMGSSLVLLVSLIVMNLLMGVVIHLVAGVDMTTALFATAPGGLSDMSLIAEELGGNTAQVAVLGFVRLLTILLVCIPLFKILADNGWRFSRKNGADRQDIQWSEPVKSKAKPSNIVWADFLLTLIAAAVGGVLLASLGIPAGGLVGAMLFATLFNVFTGKACFPPQIQPWMLCIVGAYLGVGITRESLISLTALPIPVMLVVVNVLVSTFSIAFLMHKLSGLPLPECFLSSTPGGLQEMSLLAEDMGADTPKVAIMQTLRLFAVILIFPQVLRFFALLFL